ncbi:LPS export ABC transporter permease LptF, partial [Candidatus Saccharibacteria bacterium]|nr:LPS export ABC transporter permease LptF [Candidatus Saccharibacteria bacterium]
MQIALLINKYIFKEFISPFVVNVLFFTFIFLMAELIQITNWIVNYNINLFTILRMIIYQTPYFLIFVIPLSIMITILLTFLKLSSENEIMAIKSGGISIYGLLAPVGVFCLIGFVLTLFMTVYGQAWGRTALRALTLQVVSESIDIGLKERTFDDSFDGVTIYVNEINLRNKNLVDVFIEDNRQPDRVNTVIAPRGIVFSDPDNATAHLRLFNGSIHQTNLNEKTAHAIHFDTYEISLDTKRSVARKKAKPKRPKEMSFKGLRRFVQSADRKDGRYFSVLLELHRRLALPFGCFALGIIAVPLGVQSRSAKRSFGLVLGLFFFLFYYLLMSMGKVYGETGAYPPQVGMWLPNGIIGGLGVYFFIRTANERTLKLDTV